MTPRERLRSYAAVRASADLTRSAQARIAHERAVRRRRRGVSSVAVGPVAARAVDELRQHGVTVVRQAVSSTAVEALARQAAQVIAEGVELLPPRDETVRGPGDLRPYDCPLPLDLLRAGPDPYRDMTHHVVIAEPLLSCPATLKLAFVPLLEEIAQQYLGAPPAVANVNLRQTFVNDLPASDILCYHRDRNAWRFLKFFVYLRDVDEEGGPFCYVRGTHRRRPLVRRDPDRLSLAAVDRKYGQARVVLATAKAGDIVVADTTGMHRGTKPIARDRLVLTLDYGVQVPFSGRTRAPSIARTDVQALKRPSLADFLGRVEQ